MFIPVAKTTLNRAPQFAFSADGSKFAMMAFSGMFVSDIRSKVPLQTFTELPWLKVARRVQEHPQFSSGHLGKEILVFVEVCLMFTF